MVLFPLAKQEKVRRAFLTSEYDKGGVPVFEVSYKQWKKQFYHLTNEDYDDPDEFMGAYYAGPFDNNYTDLPNNFIVINTSLCNSWRLAVYYHELGHHSCNRYRCSCAKNGFVYRPTELHAELASIYLARKRGFKQMTFNLLTETVLDLDHPQQNRVWNATRMVKHPVFIEAKTFCDDLFSEWLKSVKHKREHEKYLNALVDDSTRTCRWKPTPLLKRFVKS